MDQNTDRRDSAVVADDPNQHLVFHQRNSISESYSSDGSEISHSPSLPSLKRPYPLSQSAGFSDILRADKFIPTQRAYNKNRDQRKYKPIEQPEKEKGTKAVNSRMRATKENKAPKCRYGHRKLDQKGDDIENKVCWFHGGKLGGDKKDAPCQTR